MTGTLIAPVIPSSAAAAARPARAPVAARTLPLLAPAGRPPALPGEVVYGLARVDGSGRVADRSVTGALGWRGGDRVTLTPAKLLAAPAARPPAPTFAEYVPVVSALVSGGCRRAYAVASTRPGNRNSR